MTQKYDGQLAHLKNQTEESARAITLDMTQRVTATESKFTQELQKLDDRIRIIPSLLGRAAGATRSVSSIFDDKCGVMHGELYYTGDGWHAWASKTDD